MQPRCEIAGFEIRNGALKLGRRIARLCPGSRGSISVHSDRRVG